MLTAKCDKCAESINTTENEEQHFICINDQSLDFCQNCANSLEEVITEWQKNYSHK